MIKNEMTNKPRKQYETIKFIKKELGLEGNVSYVGRGMSEFCGDKVLFLNDIKSKINEWVKLGLCTIVCYKDGWELSIEFTDKLTKQKTHKRISFMNEKNWFWC